MVILVSLILAIMACKKKDTEFRDFFGGKELVYPGVGAKVVFRPGNLRVQLSWNPSPDQNVSKYMVFWNNRSDSLTVKATSHNPSDTVKVVIGGLREYVYSFTIFSYDAKGNRSVPLEVNNVKVYGPIYQSGMINRTYNVSSPFNIDDRGVLTLNFNTPDTIIVATDVRYTNQANQVVEKKLLGDIGNLVLTDYKRGTPIDYRSAYIPARNALDTFYVADYTPFPQVYSDVVCDKSKFAELRLPNDVGTYNDETPVRKLWDGTVGAQDYPNIYHSDGSHTMPHHLTFDMGKIYSHLSFIEETGRKDSHNPDDFEVWGIADITNAATSLQGNNAGWANEMTAKGWTLLKTVKRVDNGAAPYKVALMDSPPPVRYIRIRIRHVTSNSAESSNMSELTFWNREN